VPADVNESLPLTVNSVKKMYLKYKNVSNVIDSGDPSVDHAFLYDPAI
jgi:hypothetical protein